MSMKQGIDKDVTILQCYSQIHIHPFDEKAMLQVAPPSTKGYFSTIFIKYLSKMIFNINENRELIKIMTICNVIHRFIYIRLMKGHFAGGATFHQGVLLDYLH